MMNLFTFTFHSNKDQNVQPSTSSHDHDHDDDVDHKKVTDMTMTMSQKQNDRKCKSKTSWKQCPCGHFYQSESINDLPVIETEETSVATNDCPYCHHCSLLSSSSNKEVTETNETILNHVRVIGESLGITETVKIGRATNIEDVLAQSIFQRHIREELSSSKSTSPRQAKQKVNSKHHNQTAMSMDHNVRTVGESLRNCSSTGNNTKLKISYSSAENLEDILAQIIFQRHMLS